MDNRKKSPLTKFLGKLYKDAGGRFFYSFPLPPAFNMTVAELIEKLKEMPPDAIVVSCYDVHDGDLGEVGAPFLHTKPAEKLPGLGNEFKGKQVVEL